MKKFFAVLCLLIAPQAIAKYPAGKLQRKLAEHMSESRVVELLGEPDGVTLHKLPDGTRARSFKYKTDLDTFVVTFTEYVYVGFNTPPTAWLIESWGDS